MFACVCYCLFVGLSAGFFVFQKGLAFSSPTRSDHPTCTRGGGDRRSFKFCPLWFCVSNHVNICLCVCLSSHSIIVCMEPIRLRMGLRRASTSLCICVCGLVFMEALFVVGGLRELTTMQYVRRIAYMMCVSYYELCHNPSSCGRVSTGRPFSFGCRATTTVCFTEPLFVLLSPGQRIVLVCRVQSCQPCIYLSRGKAVSE